MCEDPSRRSLRRPGVRARTASHLLDAGSDGGPHHREKSDAKGRGGWRARRKADGLAPHSFAQFRPLCSVQAGFRADSSTRERPELSKGPRFSVSQGWSGLVRVASLWAVHSQSTAAEVAPPDSRA